MRAIHNPQPPHLNRPPQILPARSVPERAEERVENGRVPSEEMAGCGGGEEEEEEPDEGDEEGVEEDGGGEVETVVEGDGGLRGRGAGGGERVSVARRQPKQGALGRRRWGGGRKERT